MACDIREKFNRRATFYDIVEFVEKQVKIASDPLFGDIQDTPGTARKESNPGSFRTGTKRQGCSFVTNVAPAEDKVELVNKRKRNLPEMPCLFCGAGHSLDVCLQLDKRTQNEKIYFLKENGLCFGCLFPGHRSRKCKRRLTCRICNLKHPTMLHVQSKPRQKGYTQASYVRFL